MTAALDAGCGPGRTALELAKVFDFVEAYDYSQGFVEMLKLQMNNNGIRLGHRYWIFPH
jgi:2-polyprenyl-3-methyl-5-hydroxy-6-metoxy-1,4-benzoquinol methylase